jgi:hypothetical protein
MMKFGLAQKNTNSDEVHKSNIPVNFLSFSTIALEMRNNNRCKVMAIGQRSSGLWDGLCMGYGV